MLTYVVVLDAAGIFSRADILHRGVEDGDVDCNITVIDHVPAQQPKPCGDHRQEENGDTDEKPEGCPVSP